jgi:ComF family protein
MELKFHQLLVNAAVLGRLLADALQAHGHYSKSLPDVILPVPLHRERLSERGFNQALEIARPISKVLQIPIAIQSAERTRHTAAQARLNAEKRGENLRNAFKIRTNVAGLHIAILDDVITTGRTVESLSRALKAAGAKRVDVWAVARAILNG